MNASSACREMHIFDGSFVIATVVNPSTAVHFYSYLPLLLILSICVRRPFGFAIVVIISETSPLRRSRYSSLSILAILLVSVCSFLVVSVKSAFVMSVMRGTSVLNVSLRVVEMSIVTKALFTLATRNEQALTSKIARMLSKLYRDLIKSDVSLIIATVANPKGRRTHIKVLEEKGK